MDHLLLVRANERDTVYIIDYTDVLKPRTIKLSVKKQSMVKRFNIYQQIAPKEDFVGRHRQTNL